MLTISVREFQLEASKYLKQLPIVLTVYNKPVAQVVSVNESVDTSVDGSVKEDVMEKGQEKVYEEITYEPVKGYEPKEESTPTQMKKRGFCEGHFERGVDYDLQLVAYEDADGNESTPKWICPSCIAKVEQQAKQGGRVVVYK